MFIYCKNCGKLFDSERQGVDTPYRGSFCSMGCRDMDMVGAISLEKSCELEMENEDLNESELCAVNGIDDPIDAECPQNCLLSDDITCGINGKPCIGIECEAHRQPAGRGRKLAQEHWQYVKGIIEYALCDVNIPYFLDNIKYHYITAFEHGHRHGIKDAIKKARGE